MNFGDLKINSWYNFTNSNGENNFYSQLGKIEGDAFYFKNRFCIVNDRTEIADYINFVNMDNIRLVDSSEYQHYLPETHPDFNSIKTYELW